MAVLSKIRALFQQRQLTAAEAYKQQVLQIVDKGEQPDDALDVCLAAQRTLGDLERDVTTLAARIEAAKSLVEASKLAKQEAALAERSVKTYRDLEAMEVRHREAERAKHAEWKHLEWEREGLSNQMGATRESAMRTLNSTADPTIGQQIAMLQQERDDLLRQNNNSVTMFMGELKHSNSQTQASYDRQREKNNAELKAMLDSNGQRIADIAEEIAALEKKRLDPYAFRFSE